MHLLFMDTNNGLDTSSGDRGQHIDPSMVCVHVKLHIKYI